ncbi:multicopper oxidase domain-containing protein [Methylomonas sp. SURF-2]|uniref:Multicopper oxidase CueO n=1 Tax=Methylomonas subterranea TaxID=2952225 RepID=A0ABT1TDL8_9GAMM|nr:multicopper oxidase domain-containing protein [Methylomonas sp. SURF-2]MCQ8103366.1 multicopper oxidase domain-containing protein [Methylomonas sp. SURF-2]
MKYSINPSRRRFFAQTGAGLLAYAGLPGWLRAMEGMGEMPKMTPKKASANFHPDVEIDLICKPSTVSILPGQPTRVQQYFAKLVKGPANTLTEIPDSYLGPVLRFEKGQKIRINLHNQLTEPTVTHWHGLHVPAEQDGHPLYAIDKGETLVYEFEMLNRASMNIYHPHPHNTTAKQVYHGLAGAILVNDDEERRLELPAGEYEVPIVIQDRLFDANNQLQYVRHMHDRMMGFYGDRILVNGRANFQLDVASRAYRFRVLNGSTARIYKLAWDDKSPVTVIGTDGGLLETPVNKPYVMLAPGERLDVWADFSGRKVGSQLVLRSRSFSGVLPKMAERMMTGKHGGDDRRHGGGGHRMGMGMHGSNLPVGSDYPIFTVRVTKSVSDSPKLPNRLSTIKHYTLADTANPNKPVPIGISEGPMKMVLNGRPYAYNDVLPSERIPLNTVQLMEIFHAHGGGHGGDKPSESGGHKMGRMGMMGGMNHDGDKAQGEGGHRMGGMGMGMRHGNDSGEGGHKMGGMGGMGMMMSMAHPIHLHGQYFQILGRNIGMGESDDYATVKDGFINGGWKDTVLVMPGESVKIIKPFQDFKGLFMYHCHNLEHEDMGMMRDFLVE